MNDKVAAHEFACWAMLRGVVNARHCSCKCHEQAQTKHKGPTHRHKTGASRPYPANSAELATKSSAATASAGNWLWTVAASKMRLAR